MIKLGEHEDLEIFYEGHIIFKSGGNLFYPVYELRKVNILNYINKVDVDVVCLFPTDRMWCGGNFAGILSSIYSYAAIMDKRNVKIYPIGFFIDLLLGEEYQKILLLEDILE